MTRTARPFALLFAALMMLTLWAPTLMAPPAAATTPATLLA